MADNTGNFSKSKTTHSITGWSNTRKRKIFVRWTNKEIERLCVLRSSNAQLTWEKFAFIYNTLGLPYRGARALSNKYKRVRANLKWSTASKTPMEGERVLHPVEETSQLLSPQVTDVDVPQSAFGDMMTSGNGEDATQEGTSGYEIPFDSNIWSPVLPIENHAAASEMPEYRHAGIWAGYDGVLHQRPYYQGYQPCGPEDSNTISHSFFRSLEIGGNCFDSGCTKYWRQLSPEDEYVWAWSAHAMDWEFQMHANPGGTALARKEG